MVNKNLYKAAAAAILALLLASCTEPIDLERGVISSRQAIELMAEGERYEKEGNYRMALDKYNKALDLAQSPRIYYRLGSCYFSMGEYARAREYLTVAEQLAGDFPEASYLLSRTRTQLAFAAARPGQQPAAAPTAPTPTPAGRAPSELPKPTSPEVAVSSAPTPKPAVEQPTKEAGAVPTSPYAQVFTPIPSRPTEPATVDVQPSPRPTPEPTEVAPPKPLPRPEVVEPAPAPETKPAAASAPTITVIDRTTSPLAALVPTTPPPSVRVIAPAPPTTPVSVAAATPTAAKAVERREAPVELPLEKIFPDPRTTAAPSASSVASPVRAEPTTTTVPLLTDWRFHWQQALSFNERKQYEDAIGEFQLVLGAQPTHLDARLELADCYDRLGQGQKALEQYEKARMFHPVNPKSYFRSGNYYLRHAEENPAYYDRARDFYFQAVTHDPQYYFAHHNIAVTYMKQSDYERARLWFDRALKIKPDYATARRNLGLLYELHLNDREAATREYRAYLLLRPDDKEVADWLRALEEATK